MAKTNKSIADETLPDIIQELADARAQEIVAEREETPEEREERLKREDYARRNAQAIKDREDILRRNGVIGPDESLTVDMEAAIAQRCCI